MGGCGWLVTATQYLTKRIQTLTWWLSSLVEHNSTVSQVCFPGRAKYEMVCLSLSRNRSGDINQSPWSKARRPGRASQVKRSLPCDVDALSSWRCKRSRNRGESASTVPGEDQGYRHARWDATSGAVIQKVTAGAPRCGVVDKVVESLCLQRPAHTREQQPSR